MRIALTGATGFIGSHLTTALVAAGVRVRALLRPRSASGREHQLRDLPTGVDVVRGDLGSDSALRELVRGQDAVVHLAGLTRATSAAAMDASNVGGTRALLTAMRDAAPPPAHLVLISSQAAVGPSWDGRPVAENRDARPVSRYGRSKRGAERLAIREPRPVSVVRPPTVYGPRERDVLSYFRLVHRGILPVLSHETTLSIVYVHNLIDALLRVLGGPAPPPGGRILHVADAGATSMAAFGVMIAAHYHRHVHRVVVPVAFLAALGFLLEGLSVASGKAALLGRDKLREIRQPAWLLSTRASANLLGYAPALDTAAGIAETARWYAEHGWL